MEELTPKQKKDLARIEEISQMGEMALVKRMFDIEDKLDEEIPQMREVLGRIKGDKGEDYAITEEDKAEIAEEAVFLIDQKKIAQDASLLVRVPIDEIAEKAARLIPPPKNGNPPSRDEIVSLIKPLIPAPIPGEKGKDFTPDLRELATNTVNMLETFKGDDRLSAKAIKGLGKYATKKKVDEDIATLQNRTQLLVQIASQRTNTTTGGSQSLQEVTDIGATTDNTITISPSGSSQALILNGAGSGTALNIDHAGSGTKLNITDTGSGDLIVAGTSKFVVTNAGNVGIGTVSPSARLQVNTTATPSTTVIGQYIVNATSGNNAGAAIRLGYGASSGATVGISGYYNATTETGMFMAFGVGATTYMTLSPTGRLGLGTNGPVRTFHISDAVNNYQLRMGSTGSFNYDFGRNGSNGLFSFYGNQTGAVGYIFEGVNGEAMRIDTSRRLGVGTGATVAARVEINTVSAATIGLIVQGAASQTGNLQEWQDSAGNILASVNQLGVISSVTDIISGGAVSGLSGYFYDGANVTTYLALSGVGLDTANGNVGAQIAGSGFAGNFYDVSNSLIVCDGTYAMNATGISYLNGAIQTPSMPTADPVDGTGTLWYDTITNLVYRGT